MFIFLIHNIIRFYKKNNYTLFQEKWIWKLILSYLYMYISLFSKKKKINKNGNKLKAKYFIILKCTLEVISYELKKKK